MKHTLFISVFLIFFISFSQDNTVSLGTNNLSNININYEIETNNNYNLRIGISRNLINGSNSNKKFTYNFGSISAKVYDREMWGFEIYHGPVLLIGYFYEHTNFRNNTLYYPIYNGDYQSSAMISTQYSLGVEREMGDNIYLSGELAAGSHILFNDDMTILEKYNLGNFIPYIGLNIYVGYRF